MIEYQPYVEHLNELVEALVHDHRSAITFNAEAIQEALDGGAPAALRRLATIEDRRNVGAFFTSSTLADLAWAPLLPTLDHDSVIVDPACGAGSLLIPGLRALLRRTDPWRAANQLRGRDLVGSFVEATRARLTLTIASSQPPAKQLYPHPLRFPELQPGDALKEMAPLLDGATHIVLNPPYTPIIAPEDCTWASGKINHAAVFTEVAVSHMPADSRMVAILPEVLRSGPRYAKWREIIRQTTDIDQVVPSGAFDAQTDVDVFRLYLTKHRTRRAVVPRQTVGVTHLSSERGFHGRISSNTEQHVSTYFEISVGAVVPHRHPEIGPVNPFATARELPAWETISTLATERSFSGRCDTPPFVAIRRTSRPGQVPRALATIIAGTKPVAVDNHLIVARPLDGSLARCQQLLDLLQQPRTTEWLDERYRCHHLPVEAIRLIPWAIAGGNSNG
jgi:N-6 DNA Methylase